MGIRKVAIITIVIATCLLLNIMCVLPFVSEKLQIVNHEGGLIITFNAIMQINDQGYGVLSREPEKYLISSQDFEKGLKGIAAHKNLTYSGEEGSGFYFTDNNRTTIGASSRPLTLGYWIIEFGRTITPTTPRE